MGSGKNGYLPSNGCRTSSNLPYPRLLRTGINCRIIQPRCLDNSNLLVQSTHLRPVSIRSGLRCTNGIEFLEEEDWGNSGHFVSFIKRQR